MREFLLRVLPDAPAPTRHAASFAPQANFAPPASFAPPAFRGLSPVTLVHVDRPERLAAGTMRDAAMRLPVQQTVCCVHGTLEVGGHAMTQSGRTVSRRLCCVAGCACCRLRGREEVERMSIKDLKALLAGRGVDTRSFLERSEFVARAKALL